MTQEEWKKRLRDMSIANRVFPQFKRDSDNGYLSGLYSSGQNPEAVILNYLSERR